MDFVNEAVSSDEAIALDRNDVSDFIDFLSADETYLDTGLGAFHTDNHSNW